MGRNCHLLQKKIGQLIRPISRERENERKKNQLSFTIMTDFVENRKTKQPNNILLQNGYIMSSLSIQYTTKKRSLNRIESAHVHSLTFNYLKNYINTIE